jgi:hypothetical protein
VTDNDLELNEYRDIKRWVEGRKPAAQGRIWWRRAQVQFQKTLPTPLRRVSYSMAPGAGSQIVALLWGLFITNVSIITVQAFFPAPVLPATQALVPIVEAARDIFNFLAGFLIVLYGAAWLIAGD